MKTGTKANLKSVIAMATHEETPLHRLSMSVVDVQFDLQKVLGTLRIMASMSCVASDKPEDVNITFEDVHDFLRWTQETLEQVNEGLDQVLKQCGDEKGKA